MHPGSVCVMCAEGLLGSLGFHRTAHSLSLTSFILLSEGPGHFSGDFRHLS